MPNESDVIHTNMWRVTWQFGVPMKLSEAVYFIPRIDAGALFGKIYFENDSTKETWNGMTFSFGPFAINRKTAQRTGRSF